MARSPDHPELAFVQAKGYTQGRPDGKPLWIVVHDMEAGENSLRAESTAAYFADPSDGRSVSSHYCVDDNSVVQCVLLADSAWTVGNRPGNNRGINWELSGFARQTREQWLDPFGLAMFRQMAPIVQADAAQFGIPLERRTIADLKARRPGITSHNDLAIAFGGSDHTDPGRAFPWDVFMAIMRGEDMALTPETEKQIEATAYRVESLIRGTAEITTVWSDVDPEGVEPNWTVRKLNEIELRLKRIEALFGDGGPSNALTDVELAKVLRLQAAAMVKSAEGLEASASNPAPSGQ